MGNARFLFSFSLKCTCSQKPNVETTWTCTLVAFVFFVSLSNFSHKPKFISRGKPLRVKKTGSGHKTHSLLVARCASTSSEARISHNHKCVSNYITFYFHFICGFIVSMETFCFDKSHIVLRITCVMDKRGPLSPFQGKPAYQNPPSLLGLLCCSSSLSPAGSDSPSGLWKPC